MVQRRNQHPGRDADRFLHVVVLHLPAVWQHAVGFAEDGDEIGCRVQERLVGIGAERRQRVEPLPGRALLVEVALLLFRRFPDAMVPDIGKKTLAEIASFR